MIIEQFRLTGQVAIVTGAGRGIGRAIASGFGEAGARLVCAARTAEDIEAVAAGIRDGGGEAVAVPCDVTVPAELDALVEATLAQFGRVDLLVNNAGGTPPCAALRVTDEEFEAAFHFNVTSAFRLTRLVVPHMVARGGAIVNISSAMAHVVEAGFVAYGTAKAALSHMTRLLAWEFAPHVRVNALAVGATQTEVLELFVEDRDLKARMEARTPMGRLGTVEDIALAALYLASPASSWITGKVLEVDGGAVASTWPLTIPAF